MKLRIKCGGFKEHINVDVCGRDIENGNLYYDGIINLDGKEYKFPFGGARIIKTDVRCCGPYTDEVLFRDTPRRGGYLDLLLDAGTSKNSLPQGLVDFMKEFGNFSGLIHRSHNNNWPGYDFGATYRIRGSPIESSEIIIEG